MADKSIYYYWRRVLSTTANKTPLLTRAVMLTMPLTVMPPIAPASQTDKVKLSVDVSKTGSIIDRNLFGQFAEHLGNGVYEGIWVGPDSRIPNTRGIRNDVVAALKAIRVPNVRWPGGCFADEYHWRKRIGPQRVVTLNPNWGGVIEPNTFGTHEFLDFLDQIGAEAFLSVNVGSGTPQEAAEWLEYLTTPLPTTLSKERTANGHPAPYKIAYLGIGNESWDCGGNMTPDYYVSQLKFSAASSGTSIRRKPATATRLCQALELWSRLRNRRPTPRQYDRHVPQRSRSNTSTLFSNLQTSRQLPPRRRDPSSPRPTNKNRKRNTINAAA